MHETEIKYRLGGVADHDRLRDTLIALGATGHPDQQEENWLFDTATNDLRRGGVVLRLRCLDGRPDGILTYKGPAQYSSGVKSRPEYETAVSDLVRMRAILEALGYAETNAYQKRREAWHLGQVEVVLDTLDFGYFCEIEGEVDAIRHAAAVLNLSDDQIETSGYPSLARVWQSKRRAERNALAEESDLDAAIVTLDRESVVDAGGL